MDTHFNFNSAICTSREQSERLLALGLKKETADCGIYYSELAGCDRMFAKTETEFDADEIPAWSLHRLVSLLPDSIYHKNKACFFYLHSNKYCEWRSEIWKWGASNNVVEIFAKSDLWENLCDCIEWLIKEKYFKNEYLV